MCSHDRYGCSQAWRVGAAGGNCLAVEKQNRRQDAALPLRPVNFSLRAQEGGLPPFPLSP